ncbi:ligase-associated DNA damage response exonuclease [Parvularcula dongshanensis]|uniref:Putative mRNA 3-end processing factor n=1 Tax=Parvularcula dongshanensis TaxID=1173995 RepID=A0A840I3W1_9PROT|nr:ligase-associated DNA damage response exonuclease [Parvularcula dongshanensis]MBB4658730.1 putative mRNA 3-end processing factor [Parvularcula dongshanensis]
MKPEALLHPTPAGLYCPPGDFYIDPVRPVDRAVVTHGHADHARSGHGAVLATPETLEIMATRYGEDFTERRQSAEIGEVVNLNGVALWLVPAGHVLGSAQAVVEHKGTRMVVTGDYKRRRDPTCAGFEPVPCDVLISEATFGLPVFRHPDTAGEVAKLLHSLEQFPERAHLVGAYALGKAQRIIRHLREQGYDETIYIHGAMQRLCDLYERLGVPLGPLAPATVKDGRGAKQDFEGKVVVCPPSAMGSTWARRFPDPVIAFASGWMRVRQRAKQKGVELPLIVSDHADWDELTDTVREVDPHQLWVTHGREDALVRWAEVEGRVARPLHLIGYEDEND